MPVLGQLDVTTEELAGAAIQAARLAAVTLAFAAYALLLDHDRCSASARFARKSALVVALATRLVPTLERDVARARRGAARPRCRSRGRPRAGAAPVAARLGLARACRSTSRRRWRPAATAGPGATRAPAPRWRPLDRLALAAAVAARAGSAMALATVATSPSRTAAPIARRCRESRSRSSPARSSLLLGPLGMRQVDAHPRARRARAALSRRTFAGTVEVAGHDTRRTRPAELAGTVATLFQDPEDQVVFGGVLAEVAFGLENAGTPPRRDRARARGRRSTPSAPRHLADRQSRGALGRRAAARLPRVDACARAGAAPSRRAHVPARRRRGARAARARAPPRARARHGRRHQRAARRPRRLRYCDRVVDASSDGAIDRRRARRSADALEPGPSPVVGRGRVPASTASTSPTRTACPCSRAPRSSSGAARSSRSWARTAAGKTTLAKIAAGLLEPDAGRVEPRRHGRRTSRRIRAGTSSRERCDDEVALGARDGAAAARALAAVGLDGLRGTASARPVERRARAAGSGGRARDRARPARPRRADARRRPGGPRASSPRLLRREAAGRATLLVTHDHDLVAAAADRTVELGERIERVAA